MPISSGDKLGPYEIVAPIGKGGMGEVWKARDTRLDRVVAIKVSQEQFSERFEREAKAIAALNHSSICTLYDVGPNYLVMEYIEGAPLKGPLPVDQALKYAVQICDALDAAHKKGITHRDLKPANILVAKAGIKLLDFGLAKLGSSGIGPAAKPPDDATLTMALTGRNEIVGTLYYMSPEQLQAQATGQEIDSRSDIFSFGLVLYEMLTGKRAFDGSSPASVIAAIMERSAPSIAEVAPVALDRVLKTCLAKDPDERWQSARDLKRELESIASASEFGIAAPAIPTRRDRSWLAWCIAAFLLLALIPANIIHFRETPAAEPVLHLSVPLPGDVPAPFLALSPDGLRLAISFTAEGKTGLWLRTLDSLQLQFLPGTENARSPFWSPDSKFIGFFADAKLKTIPAAGGPPRVLCEDTGSAVGGTWNRDGVILYSGSGVGRPLQRVNASGGGCTVITKPERGSRHSDPTFLPDGKHFVYVVGDGDEAGRGLYVDSLDHPAPRRLFADVSSAVFVPSTTGKKYGYLLFLRGNVLMAQPFSTETLQLAGEAIPVATEASFSFDPPQIAVSASSSGILVYEANLFGAGFQLTWSDRSGKELGKVGNIQIQRHVALSPDGKAVSTRTREGMWLYDVQRGGATRFASPATSASGAAVWSPDGNRVAFGSGNDLYLKDASGDAKEELLLANEHLKTPSDWSRDGHYLIYTETERNGRGDIWYLPDPLNKSSEKKPVKFQGTEATESQGQLSPDGRWLAYVSNVSGQDEVYVRPFPIGLGRWKISAGQTRSLEPRWRQDGKELFFVEAGLSSNSNRLMAVAVQPGPRGDFQAGAPQALFEFHSIASSPALNMFMYSPSADGQRFLVNAVSGGAAPTLNLITNWEKAALGSR